MLELKNLVAVRGDFSLKDVSFEVADGEYCALLGPTGHGKTVLLESIAGIFGIRSGEIWINGRNVTSLSVEERNVSFAFQKYKLHQHLTVRDNLTFGVVGWREKTQQEIDEAVDNVIELLKLQDLLDKRPWSLSGGETQKIVLARAIALKPDLLLADEPLASVDAHLKEGVEKELKAVHKKLGLTTIHVTHDFGEAMAIADRIVVMIDGQIRQLGTPDEVFRHPNSELVAQFFLTRNILEGEVADGAGGQGVFCLDGSGEKLNVVTPLRGKRHASIRPEEISILREPPDSDDVNSLPGTITHVSDLGSLVYVWVDVPPEFTCIILYPTFKKTGMEEGQRIYITFKVSAVNIF